MASEISGSSAIGSAANQHLQLQIGSMGSDRDLSKYSMSDPLPTTMNELRSDHPELYQEILLQVFETVNMLIKKQLDKSQQQWKENWRPK